MPTVREIAEQAGVAISTVSLALNNKNGVSEATRQRILDVAAELRRQELANNREHEPRPLDKPTSILILHPARVDDEVFTKFLRGIWAAAANPSIRLQMIMNEPDVLETNIYELLFADEELLPDGVLVLGGKREDPVVDRFVEMDVPVVLTQRESRNPAISSVGVDEIGMAFTATEYLLELGHRAIAFCGAKPDYTYTDGRLAGYRKAMAARQIEVPDRWLGRSWDQCAIESLLARSPEITAVVFLDDGYAVQFGMPALEAAGYRVPEDISVVSFDNISEAINYAPPITSVELPFYECGYRAVKVLEEQFRNPMLHSQQVRLKTILHKRASCGPPRGNHSRR